MGGVAITLFLQETGPAVSILVELSKPKVYQSVGNMAQNRKVRIRVIFAILTIATVCALSARVSGVEAFTTSLTAPDPEARIDINSASLDELLKVPGMTRTWAARIIRYRPYRGKNDLLDRGVVPSQVYDRIKDYIIAHRAKS